MSLLTVQIWVTYFIQPRLLIPNPNLTLSDIVNVTCPAPDTVSFFPFKQANIQVSSAWKQDEQFLFLKLPLTQIAPTAPGPNRRELSDRLSVTAHRRGLRPQIFLDVSGSRIRVSGSIPLSLGRL